DAAYDAGGSEAPVVKIGHATRHILNELEVQIPLQRLVCLTGVSGSGKSTLLREILLPALNRRLQSENGPAAKASDRLDKDKDLEDTEQAEAGGGGAGAARAPCGPEGSEPLSQVL